MKIHVVIAVLALSGGAGLAAAGVPLLGSPDLAPALTQLAPGEQPVIVIEPAALAALPRDAAAAPVRIVSSIATSIARELERVDRLPTHILLSDGSLVASYGEATGSVAPGVLVRESVAAPRDLPPAPGPGAAALERRTESPGFADDFASPTRTSSPGPEVAAESLVFDPRPTGSGPSGGMFVAGGVAIAALVGLGVLLYHRIRPNAALENATRKVIFDAVCATPGLGVHEISRLAGVSYSTTTYHLERLIAAGMIVMTPDGNKLCYYKNGGAFSENERKILPLLKNEEAAKLFEAILDAPGTYRAALAEKLGVTATTINWHLRRLREAGLVDETRAGRSAHLYARTDALRPTFVALASKVEASEPIVAQKLRRYAGDTPGEASAVGAA